MSKLISSFVEFLRLLKMIFLIKDIYWAKKLIANSINAQDVRYERKSGYLFLKRLSIRIRKGEKIFLCRDWGYRHAVLLVESLGARFYTNEQDEVFVDIAGLTANIRSRGEILRLKEILIDGTYNMLFSGSIVVWDIGMNVGLASLYFASKPDVVVVGYEPFKNTYNHALYNISLNPTFSDRIQTFNMGLSDSTEKVFVEYNEEINGVLGVYGPRKEHQDGLSFEREEIVLTNARHALDSIITDYSGRAIVAKIDCEGSEYQIIKDLAAAGKLCLLDAIMMEWHILKPGHDPTLLTSLLCDSGFKVFLLAPRGKVGMLYAARGNHKD